MLGHIHILGLGILSVARNLVRTTPLAKPAVVDRGTEHSSALQTGAHIGALDGLRGVAVLLVLAFHFGSWAQMSGFSNMAISATKFGWIGVDIFFVLSGFLITGILYDSRNKDNYLRNFYARRALRVLPLYFLVILLFLPLKLLWPAYLPGSHGFLWMPFFLTNIPVAIWGWGAVPEVLEHFWSLAIEEQFYLLWPFIVCIGTRKALLLLSAIIIVVAFIIRATLTVADFDPVTIFALTPTRMDSLAFGAFCSLAVRGPLAPAKLRFWAVSALVLCIAALLAIFYIYGTVSEYHPVIQIFGFSLLGATASATILASLTWRPLKTLLGNAILRWFGRYSFGLYVWHYPIGVLILEYEVIRMALGVETASLGAIALLLLAIALTVFVSVASFHYWETPFLRYKRHFS